MKTMICMGDSLTEGSDIPVGHTWPELAGNALNIDVVNWGIGGDTSAGMLARFHGQLSARKPSFVFILGGTNDLWWGWEVYTVLGNLFSMVVQARHIKIAPVIGIPLPVNVSAAKAADFSPPMDGYDRFIEKLEALVESLIVHAAENEVALVDLHGLFLTDQRIIKEDLFLPDGLHPNRAGHQVIADAVVAAFRKDFGFKASAST